VAHAHDDQSILEIPVKSSPIFETVRRKASLSTNHWLVRIERGTGYKLTLS
jgi:hypothetical protein